MAGHLVSPPVSRFHIGEGTDIKPAHFKGQGPLMNGVTSWQLIIKHYLINWFYGRTVGVIPSVWVPCRFGTGPLLDSGSTCEWCQKLAIDYKT